MRIYAFATFYPSAYKPYYDTQFADLIDRGHEVTVFAADRLDRVLNQKVIRYGLQERTRYYSTTLHTIPRHLPGIAASLLRDPAGALRDAREVSRESAPVRRRIVEVARMLSIRSNRPDLCLIHGLGTAILFSWLRRVLPAEVPLAMYYHGGEVPGVARWSDEDTRAAFAAMDVVFTNTEFSAQGAVERGCPREKLVVLPVGFALEDFQPPAHREYRPGGTLRLLSAGRLSEEKGFIYALRAIKRLVDQGIRDISYSLTGEGYLRAPLEQFVQSEGLEPYVNFRGTLSAGGVLHAMQASDVLLLPSIQVGDWVENQACAVQEALLSKAVVVTSQTGGVPESIPVEMERFSAPPNDDEALARAIAKVHALSVQELAEAGEAGRDFVLRNYDIRSLNSRMIDVMMAASSESSCRQARGARHPRHHASARS